MDRAAIVSRLREQAAKGRPEAVQSLRDMGEGVAPPGSAEVNGILLPPAPAVRVGGILAPPAPPPGHRGAMRLRLPWSVLVSDNDKYRVHNGRIYLTKQYRDAKRDARAKALEQLGATVPFAGPVAIRAVVIPPDMRQRRDIANHTKLVHDALTGVCYEDDSQLADVHWRRGPVNVDAPGVDITITRLDQ